MIIAVTQASFEGQMKKLHIKILAELLVIQKNSFIMLLLKCDYFRSVFHLVLCHGIHMNYDICMIDQL